MNINLPVYEIPSAITYYEGTVERNVGFIYGLSTSIDNGINIVSAALIKFPAGKYVDSYSPFFEYKYEDTTKSGDPFLEHYPYSKSFIEKRDFYCIGYSVDQPNLYYYQYTKPIKETVTSSIIDGEIKDGFMVSGNVRLSDQSLETISGEIISGINLSGSITYQQVIGSDIISGWTTDKNKALYFFTSGTAASQRSEDTNIICTHNYIIKNIIIDGLTFPCSSFIIDNFDDYKNI